VFSFDPFVENDRSKRMRQNNSIYSYQVALNDKWFFYRIGLTDFEHRKNINKIGWMETFANIINHQFIPIEMEKFKSFTKLNNIFL
jgi:hypothetical protein